MDQLISLLGLTGICLLIGFGVFLYCYRYSVVIFDWIEKQTFGTRNYIMERLDILMFEIPPDKLTYYLLSLSLGLFVFVVLFFGLLISWILGLVLGLIAGFYSFRLIKLIVDSFVAKRVRQYQGQMVDGLQLLSNGLRAGLSVPQAIGMVVAEMQPPLKEEFNLILQQNRVGVPLEECFENLSKRIPLEDNEMFVSSVNILRETGGNLAEVFDTIIEVIRERVRLQQKLDSLTAQGRFQAYTIASIPIAIFLIYGLSNPQTIKLAFTSPLGLIMIFLVLVLDFVGFMVIMKVVKIKI